MICWGTRKRLFILVCRVQTLTPNLLHYLLFHAHLIAHGLLYSITFCDFNWVLHTNWQWLCSIRVWRVMHARYCGCRCDFFEIFFLCEGDLLTIINCHHLRTLCPIKPYMHTYIASYAWFVMIWHHHHHHPIPILAYVMNTYHFFFLISFFWGQTQVVTQLGLFWPMGGFSNILGQFLTSYPSIQNESDLAWKKEEKRKKKKEEEGVTLETKSLTLHLEVRLQMN